MCQGSPLGELHRCVEERIRVRVHIRTFKGLRGVCSGFVVVFDKFWNMVSRRPEVFSLYVSCLRAVCSINAGCCVCVCVFQAMVDVDETYREPLLGEALYHEKALTISRVSTWLLFFFFLLAEIMLVKVQSKWRTFWGLWAAGLFILEEIKSPNFLSMQPRGFHSSDVTEEPPSCFTASFFLLKKKIRDFIFKPYCPALSLTHL